MNNEHKQQNTNNVQEQPTQTADRNNKHEQQTETISMNSRQKQPTQQQTGITTGRNNDTTTGRKISMNSRQKQPTQQQTETTNTTTGRNNKLKHQAGITT